MSSYLTYGAGPAAVLLILLVGMVRRRWKKTLEVFSLSHDLSALQESCRDGYASSWMRGIVYGVGFCALLTILSFVVPTADPTFGRVVAPYWIPAMIWAIPGSWTGLMLSGVRNTVWILNEESPRPFIAYLRDRLEERRTELRGPIDQATPASVQRGLERLTKSLPAKSLYGFWDPLDDRTGLNFEPVISTELRWKADVTALCERALAIVLDISSFSPSVAWEAKLIADSPDLAGKTLILRAASDKPIPPELSKLKAAVRRFVIFDSREERGGYGKLDLPADFLETVGSSDRNPSLKP